MRKKYSRFLVLKREILFFQSLLGDQNLLRYPMSGHCQAPVNRYADREDDVRESYALAQTVLALATKRVEGILGRKRRSFD